MRHKALNPVFLLITGLLLLLLPQWLHRSYLQSPEELAQNAGMAIEKKFERLNTGLLAMDSLLQHGNTEPIVGFF